MERGVSKDVGEGRKASKISGRREKKPNERENTSEGGGRKTTKISGRWEKREGNKREKGEI